MDLSIFLWCNDKCVDHVSQRVFLLEMLVEEEGVKFVAQVNFSKAIWFSQGVEVFACPRQVDQRRTVILEFLDDGDHDVVGIDSHVDGFADSRQGRSRDNFD